MFKSFQLLLVLSVGLLSAISGNVTGQSPKTRVSRMIEANIFSDSKIPDQKNPLVNKLVSQSYLVYRNPGSATVFPSQFRTHPDPFYRKLLGEFAMRRNVDLVESIWDFCWNRDGKGEESVLLGEKRFLYYGKHTPEGEKASLANIQDDASIYAKPMILWVFSLQQITPKKLAEEYAVTWNGKKMSFPPDTEFLRIEAEDVEVQTKETPMTSAGSPHSWVLDLFPMKDGGWLGTLQDKYEGNQRHEGECSASSITGIEDFIDNIPGGTTRYSSFFQATDTTDSEFGFNRTHVIYLEPVPWKTYESETGSSETIEIPTPKSK